jgi:LmbE family N-acetylglucosaminyl deacetylase
MLNLKWDKVSRVLCLGAHSDDIEIGCGGTMLKLLEQSAGLDVLWVVFSAEGSRAAEARAGAEAFLKGAWSRRVVVKDFRTSFFPFQGEAIKECFEELKGIIQPDLVFTHYREDRHQDHRVLSDLAWNTFRDHLILEYEIPKYDGDLGNPNFYVRLDEQICNRKVEYLCQFFQTQSNKHWFTRDTFLSLMRLRGIECVSTCAEAFYSRKLVL